MKSYKRLIITAVIFIFGLAIYSPSLGTVHASEINTANQFGASDFDSFKNCLDWFSAEGQSGSITLNDNISITDDYVLPELSAPVVIYTKQYHIDVPAFADFSNADYITFKGGSNSSNTTANPGCVFRVLKNGHLSILGAQITNTSGYLTIIQEEGGCVVTSLTGERAIQCDAGTISWALAPVICKNSTTASNSTTIFKTAETFSAGRLPAAKEVSVNYQGLNTSAVIAVDWDIASAQTSLDSKKRTIINGSFSGALTTSENVSYNGVSIANIYTQFIPTCTVVFTQDGAAITKAGLTPDENGGYTLSLSYSFLETPDRVVLMRSTDNGKTWAETSNGALLASLTALTSSFTYSIPDNGSYYFCVKAEYGTKNEYTDVISCNNGGLNYVGDYSGSRSDTPTPTPDPNPTPDPTPQPNPKPNPNPSGTISSSSVGTVRSGNGTGTGAGTDTRRTAGSQTSTAATTGGRTSTNSNASTSGTTSATATGTTSATATGTTTSSSKTTSSKYKVHDNDSETSATAEDNSSLPIWILLIAAVGVIVLILVRHFMDGRTTEFEDEAFDEESIGSVNYVENAEDSDLDTEQTTETPNFVMSSPVENPPQIFIPREQE